MEVEHFIPKHKWWSDNIENLMPSCRSCNRQKKTYYIETWRKVLENKIVELNRDTASYKTAKRFGLIKETWNRVSFYFESK